MSLVTLLRRVVGQHPAHVCPACSGASVERIQSPRRTFGQHLRRLLGLRIYECRACSRQFYDWPTK